MTSNLKRNTAVFTNPFTEARQEILRRFLIGAIILVIVPTSGSIASLATNDSLDSANLINLGLQALVLFGLIMATLRNEWPYQLRTAFLLVAIFILGVQLALIERLVTGSGQLILSAFVILSFILAGLRTGTLAALLVFLMIWIINFSARGFDNRALIDFYHSRFAFFVLPTIFLIVGAALITAIGRLLKGVQATLDRETELAADLAAEGQVLEMRIMAREQALRASFEINNRLTELLDERELIEATVDQIQQTFAVTNVQLYKLDQQEGDLKLQAVAGDQAQALLEQSISLTIGFGPIGKAAVSQEVVTISMPDHSQNHVLSSTEIMLAIPILYEQTLYGILLIQHDDRTFINDDVSYSLKLIAEQLAIALRNSQQYHRAEKLLLYEELINDIRLKIQSASNVEEVLQTAATELGQALNAPQTYIKIGRERRRI